MCLLEIVLDVFVLQGNYDAYIRTRIERLENQMKRYNWEQAQLQHMKDYVARFGHGSKKLARQAQSKEKTMAKMIAGGLTEKHVAEKVRLFLSQQCNKSKRSFFRLNPSVSSIQANCHRL